MTTTTAEAAPEEAHAAVVDDLDEPEQPAARREKPDDKPFSFRPASAAPVKRLLAQRAAEELEENLAEYDSIIEEITGGDAKQFTITINRDKPKFDDEGVKVDGWCGTYEGRKISRAEIAEEFGGGTFTATIYGPKPNGKRGTITRTTFDIPGAAIPPKRPIAAGRGKLAGAGGAGDLGAVVDKLAAQNKDTMEMFRSVMTEQKTSPQMEALLAKALDPEKSRQSYEHEKRQREEDWQRERQRREDERKAEREQREEERRLERERAQDERKTREEERKAELERVEKQREHELSMLKLQFEKERASAEAASKAQIAHIEAQTKLQVESLKAQTEAQKQAFDLQLQQAKMQAENDRKAQVEMQRSIQEMSNQHQQTMQKLSDAALQQVQANARAQSEFLMSQLQNAQGGSKQLLDTITLVDKIRGHDDDGDDDEPLALRVTEKVFEGVSKVAPGLFAAAGVRQSKRQVEERDAAEVEPGSVAVVDGGRRRKLKKRGGEVIDGEVVKPKATPAGAEAKPNDLVDFVFPATPMNAPMDLDLVEALIKNIDFAIQRNMEAKDIYERIVKRFPTSVVDYLRSQDIDEVFATLEALPTIDGWVINSLAGQAKLKAVHQIMNQAAK